MGWQTESVIQLIAGNTVINPNGLFVYNGTPAAGNIPVFAVTVPGTFTDPFGNSVSPLVEIGQQSGGHWHWDSSGNLDVNNTSSALIATWRPTDQAVLFYTPGGGAGALLSSVASVGGTDQYGNTIFQGIGSINSNVAAVLNAGILSLQAATGQIAGGFAGSVSSGGAAGKVDISSGGTTSLDATAQILLESANASGLAATFMAISAAQVQLNNTASTNIPSPNVNPGHQSAAPAAYSQSYEQASTNRINQLMDILVQTGIWHT